MSYDHTIFRIYPDDEDVIPEPKWLRADSWVNGFEIRGDFNEAVALAKIGVLSFGIPFLVHEIPLGGKLPKDSSCWVIDK